MLLRYCFYGINRFIMYFQFKCLLLFFSIFCARGHFFCAGHRWMKYSKKVSGIFEKKSLKAKIMHFLFSMSKFIGYTKQKSLLHKNEALYLNFLILLSFQHFKEHMCHKLCNIAHTYIKDLKYFEDITICKIMFSKRAGNPLKQRNDVLFKNCIMSSTSFWSGSITSERNVI